MEPSLNPTFAPVSANAPVVSVQATQTVAGVTSDSADFRTAFASAVMSLLPTGSSVTIVSVTIIDVRRRQLLTIAASVVYTVQSTAPVSTLTSSLSSGTAAMTAVLQVSYPAASVAAPMVAIIANPTAAPTTSPPIASSNTASSTNIIPGAVVGGVVGFIVLLALISFRNHQLQKKKTKILVNVMEEDKEHGGLDEVVDLKPTVKPVRQSMEESPVEEGKNSSAAVVPHNLELTPPDDNGCLDRSDELIEEGLIYEAMKTVQPSTPTAGSKFPFNIRSPFLGMDGWQQSPKQLTREDGDGDGDDDDTSHIFNFIRYPLEVQGWFSSKCSSKQSSLENGHDNDGGDDAMGDNSHSFNFIRSPLEVQGWFGSTCSSKQSSVSIGDGDDNDDGDHASAGKSYIPSSSTDNKRTNTCSLIFQ